jgi:hypothetical protein
MFPLKILPQLLKTISVLIAIMSSVVFVAFWVNLRPQWFSNDQVNYYWSSATMNQVVQASLQFGGSVLGSIVLYGVGQLVEVIVFIEREFVELKARRDRRQTTAAPQRQAALTKFASPVPEPAMTDTQERARQETALLYERARQYHSPPPAAPDISAYRPKRRWSPDSERK